MLELVNEISSENPDKAIVFLHEILETSKKLVYKDRIDKR